MEVQQERRRGQQPNPFNTAPAPANWAGLESNGQDKRNEPSQRPRSPPRRISSTPSLRRSQSSHDSGEPLTVARRNSTDQKKLVRRNTDHHDPEREHKRSTPPRPDSLGRPLSSRRSGGRSDLRRVPLKKRSQSLGEKMALAVSNPTREPPPPSKLMLYHVSRPEPRARWVFNLSKHTNVVDNNAPPEAITSTIDKNRPNLGGLVWINAVEGNLHCCLQKGVKNKAVTPVPAEVLDGWLNGQTGFWWIGALKEGHRALWDSHVVMNWAMVFIPSSPEVAARNNMNVWRDKCLPGSLRVARPGELARKILDIVADDQDKEPDQLVHTHLCILLAEGDDLELRRPKMFQAPTPTPSSQSSARPRSARQLTAGGGGGGAAGPSPSSQRRLKQSKSLGPADMRQAGLERDGAPGSRPASARGLRPGSAGGGGGADPALGPLSPENAAALEEAMEKVGKYRERVVILKEDRRSKKALIEKLRNELVEKEETFSGENERLRLERNDIKERAKGLWADVENLRRERTAQEAESRTAKQDMEGLKKAVDRLRHERNSARSDAMRWLEEERVKSSGAGGAATEDADSVYPNTPGGTSRGLASRAQSAPNGTPAAANGEANGEMTSSKLTVDAKAAAAIAKLKSKVDRLRRERDGAEKQAAALFRAEHSRMELEKHAKANAGATDEAGNGSLGAPAGGAVVASLRAEGLKLRRELQEAREEAERLRRTSSVGTVDSGGSFAEGSGGEGGQKTRALTDGELEPEADDAQKALGQLLGQALNLLGPGAATTSSPQANGTLQQANGTSRQAVPESAPETASRPAEAGAAVTLPSRPLGVAPAAEPVEHEPQASQVKQTATSQEAEKIANGRGGGEGSGGDAAVLTPHGARPGMVGEFIRQFGRTNPGPGRVDTACTSPTVDVAAETSTAGMEYTSVPMAEVVEATAWLAEANVAE